MLVRVTNSRLTMDKNMVDLLKTKTTFLGNGLYGCRVLYSLTNKPIVEMRVEKKLISAVFIDMFRTLSKLGYNSKMADASRYRGKNKVVNAKYIWY